jgi:hypothetical protein
MRTSTLIRPLSATTLALAVLLTLVVGNTPAEAAKVKPYQRSVDLTVPVHGAYRYSNDYHACRDGCARRHKALDLMGTYGQRVHAAVGGTVTWMTGVTGAPPSYGYMLTIRGDDGRSYNYIHLGHQDRGPADAYAPGIAPGSRVARGQWIGYLGCSGNASGMCAHGSHLHFEIEDATITDPYGTNRMDPYRAIMDAEQRGDRPGDFIDIGQRARIRKWVERATNRKLMRACEPGMRFCPGKRVTRLQLARMLTKVAELDTSGERTFTDVPASRQRFARAVVRAGLMYGCGGDGAFCPRRRVTRAQAARIMTRTFRIKPDASSTPFVDVEPGSKMNRHVAGLWGARAAHPCSTQGPRYCPKAPLRRGPLARMLVRGDKAGVRA